MTDRFDNLPTHDALQPHVPADDAGTPANPDKGSDAVPDGAPGGDRSKSRDQSRNQVAPDAGRVIGGRYKLIELIGEGGMGFVWLAEQREPVKRLVAVKLIKPGMDSRAVVARFDAERQALALMDHPNIAKVLDGGATDEGRPYFVMELVKGTPITLFCDHRRLNTRERLQLFLPVCQAIQHAHHKGIIHRDIKPGNVMVALYDDQPVPKVIDFGVAKATGATLTELTMHTAFETVVGTIEYMSPEQATFNNRDIDTRADVYSLGVLLYELLAGSPPFVRRELRLRAFDDMLRVIREVEPPRPSLRLSTSEGKASIAAMRGASLPGLAKTLSGDLDWIVMRALEKERSRRYSTVNALLRDLERYLNNESVEARPPSARYRLQKLVSRNRTTFVAALLVLAFVLCGTTVSVWQAIRATRASTIASQNERRAIEKEAEAVRASDAERLARAAEAREHELAELERDAAEQARQAAVVAQRESERLRDQAILARNRTREALDAMTSGMSVSFLTQQATVTQEQRDFLRHVLSYYHEFVNDADTDETTADFAARAAWRVAGIQYTLGDKEAALQAYELAAQRFADLADRFPDHRGHREVLVEVLNGLAYTLANFGEREKSLAAYERAITVRQELLEAQGDDVSGWLTLANLQHNLALQFRDRGERDKCRAMLEESRQAFRHIEERFPDFHAHQLDYAMVEGSLGLLLSDLGKWNDSKPVLHSARERLTRLLAAEPTNRQVRSSLGWLLNNTGVVLARWNELTDAEDVARQAIDNLRQLAQSSPSETQFQLELATSHELLAGHLSKVQRFDEALEQVRTSAAILDKLVAQVPDSIDICWELGASHLTAAEIHLEKGQFDQAADAFRKCLDVWVALDKARAESAEFYTLRLDSFCRAAALASGAVADKRKEYWRIAVDVNERRFPGDEHRAEREAGLARLAYEQITVMIRTKCIDEALAMLNEYAGNSDCHRAGTYDLACASACVLAALDENDSRREEVRRTLFQWLQEAVATGWRDADLAAREPDLAPVRDDPEFRAWLDHIRAASGPAHQLGPR